MTWTIRRSFAAAALLALPLLSCGDGATTAPPSSCPDDLQSVTPKVTVGASVTFDWSPRCPMALVLVEQDLHDSWWVAVPGWQDDAPSANLIQPPITYGELRGGMEHSDTTATLVPGQEYDFVLWRVLPHNSTLPCQGRMGRACLVATTTFRR